MELLKKTYKPKSKITFRCIFLLLLLMALILYFPHQVFAQSALPSELDMRDAVLGNRTFTQEELLSMDLNGDGLVDVADLVNLLVYGDSLIKVYFELSDSRVNEGDGTVNVTVQFTRSFYGTINYTVSGTANATDDYTDLSSGSISVNGSTADIPVTINDDTDIEDEETIIITLEPYQGSGIPFISGVFQTHTLRIEENDAVWNGVLNDGYMSIGFEMEIYQGLSSYRAELKSDGNNGLPEGTWTDELLDVELDDDNNLKEFSATFGPMDVVLNVQDSDPIFSVAFERTIVLTANSTTDGHVLDLSSVIIGDMTDSFDASEDANDHLNREINGNFSIIKEPTRVPIYETEDIEIN